jgi:hypothetical protein
LFIIKRYVYNTTRHAATAGISPDGDILTYDAYGPGAMPEDLPPPEPVLTKKGKPTKKASFADGPKAQKPRRLASAKADKTDATKGSFYFYGSNKKFESFKVDSPPPLPLENADEAPEEPETAEPTLDETAAATPNEAVEPTPDGIAAALVADETWVQKPKGTSMDKMIVASKERRAQGLDLAPVEQI